MSFLARLLATGLYTGYTPVAPGTAGSILGLFLYWAIPGSESYYFLIVIFGGGLLGAWSATHIEHTTGITDNQIIVVDEIVGVWIALIGLEKQWGWLALGCVLFRLFDIVKPYPARQAENLPGGWGVMLDDVIAGIYSLVSLRLIIYVVGYAR